MGAVVDANHQRPDASRPQHPMCRCRVSVPGDITGSGRDEGYVPPGQLDQLR